MAQLKATGGEGLDVSTDPKSARVPEFMYIGIVAAAMAILLVVVIATAFRGWC